MPFTIGHSRCGRRRACADAVPHRTDLTSGPERGTGKPADPHSQFGPGSGHDGSDARRDGGRNADNRETANGTAKAVRPSRSRELAPRSRVRSDRPCSWPSDHRGADSPMFPQERCESQG
ncbi:hypothetical protein Lokhon_00663 [Limimaricola hongkongensis DSM 17492]|uniref:Uncharacterized protein n=1 Tax=Limimaricola hongkongensis DSM 17492 TaxID=1122180 RepID=A0A017HF73_9RHOB|nr:hypothetical protein Lokhon_00663 [Limimaricola hongkongensis DSM 17492]